MQQEPPYPLGQNKIDYIVFHNLNKVAQLLYKEGYDPPNAPIELSQAIKELARKKGKKFIEALLELHPDKKVLLSLNSTNKSKQCGACNNDSYNQEGNYCTGCGHSNYSGSGDEDSFLGQFESYNDGDLEKYYRGIVRKSNKKPEDMNLAQEVQMIWNEIRQRKAKGKKEGITVKDTKSKVITRDELVFIGIVFLAGTLVGHGLKFNLNNGK